MFKSRPPATLPQIRNLALDKNKSIEPPSDHIDHTVDLSHTPVSAPPPIPGPSSLNRSASLRSNSSRHGVPSPLGDFQSDDVLNASSSRAHSIHLASPPLGSPKLSPVIAQGPSGALSPPLTASHGGRTPTYNGGWNPFVPPGLDGWTRESWGKRKVALISGITGQGENQHDC